MTRPAVTTVDCRYISPLFAAAYLLVDGDEAAFVENNTTKAVPLLLEALASRGMRPEQVRYACITHVHLDHAHGTSALLKACPNAMLVAHPKGARHMINPEKLEKSSREVYGELYDKLYGPMEPVAEKLVRIVGDGEALPFASGEIRCLHTPGHSRNHICFHWPSQAAVFTGDSFGLAYPALQKDGLFIFPSATPTDFDPPAARRTIERLLALQARRACLTHYGAVEDIPAAARQILEHMDVFEAILEAARALPPEERKPRSLEALKKHFREVTTRRGFSFDQAAWDLLESDLALNAAGISHAAGKDRQSLKGVVPPSP